MSQQQMQNPSEVTAITSVSQLRELSKDGVLAAVNGAVILVGAFGKVYSKPTRAGEIDPSVVDEDDVKTFISSIVSVSSELSPKCFETQEDFEELVDRLGRCTLPDVLLETFSGLASGTSMRTYIYISKETIDQLTKDFLSSKGKTDAATIH